MRLVYIPPGKFTMGSPESEAGREGQERQHEVELTKGFYLGVHEVTVGQFKQFVRDANYQTDGEKDGKGGWGVNEGGSLDDKSKYTWKAPGFKQTDDHPVVLISWNDAVAFCQWLSKKEIRRYRLATEAEWEYACRAGSRTAYSTGDRLNGPGNATIGDTRRFTRAVGQFKPNAWGLFDMHGNVWEWCADWYVRGSYSTARQTDPTGSTTGEARVQRGGGWCSAAQRCRSAARIGRSPSAYRGSYLGFRVVAEERGTVDPREAKHERIE